MQTVTIIGAGPAGLLLAHYLMRQGQYQIKLYDRRRNPLAASDTTSDTENHLSQRTFPISLQQRGLSAIDVIPGLKSAVVAKGLFARGSVLYGKRGKPRDIQRKLPMLLINRRQLVEVLLARLLEQYGPKQVSIQFNCACTNLDLKNQTITLAPTAGPAFTTAYDRLVAADGARSQVCQSLAEQSDFHYEQSVVPDVYKPVTILRLSKSLNIELSPDRIHAWRLGKGTRLLMVPQPGDNLEGTLIFHPDDNPLAAFSTGDEVLSLFQQACPPIGQLMTKEEAERLLRRPVSRTLSVRCDRLHVGGIVLIGDAAHAISPAIGQGCNAALQDAIALVDCLDRHQHNWAQTLPAFTTERLPEIHALQALADYSFPRSKPMMLEFVIRATLGKKLSRWLPAWGPPMPLNMIMDSELPYSEVLQRCQKWVNRVEQSMST